MKLTLIFSRRLLLLITLLLGTFLYSCGENPFGNLLNGGGTTGGNGGGGIFGANITWSADAKNSMSYSFRSSYRPTTLAYESHAWNFGDGTTSTEQHPTHLYKNEGTYTVDLTVSLKGGRKLQTSEQIKVASSNVEGKVTVDFTTEQLSPKEFAFINNTVVEDITELGLVYVWNFGDGSIETKTDKTEFNHTFTNYEEQYTISLTVKKDGKTLGLPKALVIVTGKDPSWNGKAGFTSIASGKRVTFTNTTTNPISGLQYIWNFGDGSENDIKNNTDAVSHDYTTYGTIYHATLTVKSGITTLSSVMNPVVTGADPSWKGTVNFTYPASIIAGTSVTFTNATSPHTAKLSYKWNFENGKVIKEETTNNPVNHTFDRTGNYNVTLQVFEEGKPVGSKTYNIFVKPSVTATANFTYTETSPKVFRFINTSNVVGDSTGVTYEWNFNNGGELVTKPDKVSVECVFPEYEMLYTVTLTVKKGTEELSSISKRVTTSVAPSWKGIVNFSISVTKIVVNEEVTFTNKTEPHTSSLSYKWDFGDSSALVDAPTNSNIKHTFTVAGVRTITLQAIENGKVVGSKSYSVVVNANANVTADFTATKISPKVFQFINTTSFTGITESELSYYWSFGDGNTLPKNDKLAFNHTFPDYNRTYTVNLKVMKGSEELGQKSYSVTTGDDPTWRGTVDFTFPSPIYTGSMVTFNNTTSPHKTGLKYTWNFDDGSEIKETTTNSSTNHTFNTVRNYSVTLKAYEGGVEVGTKTKTVIVSVTPSVNANFTFVKVASSPKEFTFTNTTTVTGHTESELKYVWSFGDTKTETKYNKVAFNHLFPAFDTTYTVTLTVKKGEGILGSRSYSVATGADTSWSGTVGFTYSPTSITAGSSVSFTNTTSPHTAALSYKWNFNDGTAIQDTASNNTVNHTFSTAGSYTVKLSAYIDGREVKNSTQTITVGAAPSWSGNVSYVYLPTVISANAPATFYNLTTNHVEGLSYQWDFGDHTTPVTSTTTESVVRAFTSAGVYTVSLKVYLAGAVVGSFEQSIRVEMGSGGGSAINFTISPTTATANSVVTFTNTTTPHVAGTNYVWNFGDGTTSTDNIVTSKTHSYTTARVYTVTLSAQAGMSTIGTATKTITITNSSDGGAGSTDSSKWIPLNKGVTNIAPSNWKADVMILNIPMTKSDYIMIDSTFTVSTTAKGWSFDDYIPTETVLPEKVTSPEEAYFINLRQIENELIASGAKQAKANGDLSSTAVTIGSKRTFKQTTATCGAISNKAYIYVEDGHRVDSETLRILGEKFDNIHGVIHANFGVENDVDGNGKVIILLLDTKGSFSGAFSSTDKYPESVDPISNHADIIYINVFGATYIDTVVDTFTHEMQHMVYFDNNYNKGKVQEFPRDDIWLNEGLSVLSPYFIDNTLPSKTDFYLNEFLMNSDCQLTGWFGGFSSYGHSALFAHYLIDRFGNDIPKRLYATASTRGISAVEEVTGMDFNVLYKEFAQAVYLSGIGISSEPKFNFKTINILNHGSPTKKGISYRANLAAGSPAHSVRMSPYTFALIEFSGAVGSVTIPSENNVSGFAAPK